MSTVFLIIGTRPEAIKLSPVFRELSLLPGLSPKVVLTGQHDLQVQHILSTFGVPVDVTLPSQTVGEQITDFAGHLMIRLADVVRGTQPDYIVVQGDTVSAFVGAWTAFLEKIPIGHVEAGLRTDSVVEPFPEEANRRLITVVADLHFAPTVRARNNLLAEHIDTARIIVSGQTGIDALFWTLARETVASSRTKRPYAVITLHRRENWGLLPQLCAFLEKSSDVLRGWEFVFPLQGNPFLRDVIEPRLRGVGNIRILEARPYEEMVVLLRAARIILTDSGGVQEEGVSLGVPVIVLRDQTERPEGESTGLLHLGGRDPMLLWKKLESVLESVPVRGTLPPHRNPYGDGQAARRVAQGVAWRLGRAAQPRDWTPSP